MLPPLNIPGARPLALVAAAAAAFTYITSFCVRSQGVCAPTTSNANTVPDTAAVSAATAMPPGSSAADRVTQARAALGRKVTVRLRAVLPDCHSNLCYG